jgi:GntR family transcriptional regulator, N-acetylglucosamine utilization regulator
MPRQEVLGSEAASLPVPPGWPDGAGRVSRSLPTPLHAQIRRLLLAMIERGELKPGKPLPTERDLAQSHGVSVAPVRQAILDLARERVLYRVRGQGTFVAGPPVVESVSHLAPFSESMRAKGFSVDVQVLRAEIVPAPRAVADGLALKDRRVILLERLALVNGEPFVILAAFLPLQKYGGLLTGELQGGSLYRTLRASYGVVPVRAETLIEVAPCSTAQSALLELAPGSPLLVAKGTTFDRNNVPVEYFRVHYRADRIQLRLDSYRRDEPGGLVP